MPIPIDENILIAAAGLIFVPLFIFFIKLIIEIGNMKIEQKSVQAQLSDQSKSLQLLNDVISEIKMVKLRLDNMERRQINGK